MNNNGQITNTTKILMNTNYACCKLKMHELAFCLSSAVIPYPIGLLAIIALESFPQFNKYLVKRAR